MNNIHIIGIGRTDLDIKVWDVRFVANNELLGVIKKTDDERFVYYTVGQQSEEFDSLFEARDSIAEELEGITH